jgi:hypothetical protein
MEITITQVSSDQEISIHTETSEYRFLVLRPQMRLGILTGGVLGDEWCDAYFAGMIPATGRLNDAPTLRIGSRARFYLEGRSLVNRLTTSTVRRLTYRFAMAVTNCAENA